MFYYVIDAVVPALIRRAPYSSDAPIVIFPFSGINFIFLWFVVRTSDRLVVFYGRAKFLSPTFEDKFLLTEEKIY